MPTPSWTVSFTMPTASNSPAKACAGHEANRTRRLDQPPSPVTQIHRPARLATRAASFRYGGRHHSGIPGDIIPLYPGDFVGIRISYMNYYNETRTHLSLDKDSPLSRTVERAGHILCRPILGGCITNMSGFDLRQPQGTKLAFAIFAGAECGLTAGCEAALPTCD